VSVAAPFQQAFTRPLGAGEAVRSAMYMTTIITMTIPTGDASG